MLLAVSRGGAKLIELRSPRHGVPRTLVRPIHCGRQDDRDGGSRARDKPCGSRYRPADKALVVRPACNPLRCYRLVDLTLLINREDDGVGGRIDRRELVSFQDALHRTQAHSGRLGKCPARPVGALARRRPQGQIDISFRDRCRVRDEEHIAILEHIARYSENEGFRLVAIRDLFDRGRGRPKQAIEGTGPGGAIPFTVVLPVAISSDDD
jgi:hypothetical protein